MKLAVTAAALATTMGGWGLLARGEAQAPLATTAGAAVQAGAPAGSAAVLQAGGGVAGTGSAATARARRPVAVTRSSR